MQAHHERGQDSAQRHHLHKPDHQHQPWQWRRFHHRRHPCRRRLLGPLSTKRFREEAAAWRRPQRYLHAAIPPHAAQAAGGSTPAAATNMTDTRYLSYMFFHLTNCNYGRIQFLNTIINVIQHLYECCSICHRILNV